MGNATLMNLPITTEVPQEMNPLLGKTKRNNGTSSSGASHHTPKSWAKILLALLLIAALASVATVKWQNKSKFVVNDDKQRHAYRKNADKEAPWWMDDDQVQVTETILPGQIIPNKSSLRSHTRKLRWGILGLGRIARDFTTALIMTGASVEAVAAGSKPNATSRAQEFAHLYQVPKSYGSYSELAQDPSVDIVYISTINTLHYKPAMMMLRAGKSVLIEKPMTMHLHQAQELAQVAKEQQRLLLTNYWTRFFPVMKYVRSVLAGGRLGPISGMHGDFGFPTPFDNQDRFLNRLSGGGAMLDVGCYLVNLAVMVQSNADLPSHIQSTAQRTAYGGTRLDVDTEIAFHLNWDNNHNTTSNSTTRPMIMSGQASFRRPSSFQVEVDGQHGRLIIHSPANAPSAATIYEYNEPFGRLKRVEEVRSQLPPFDKRFGTMNYPRGEGFVYIINEIEECMLEHGIPGDVGRPGCLGLEEQLSMEEQLLTVQITETVMKQAGYWDW